VPEPAGGAHVSPDEAARLVKKYILDELVQLQGISGSRLIKARYDKYRSIGKYSSRLSVIFSKERSQLYDYLSQKVEEMKERMPSRSREAPLEEEPPLPDEAADKEKKLSDPGGLV
jgi:hypothetical protein